MLTQTIVRYLPLSTAGAFAWLTDYADGDSAVLGRGTGRTARRIDEWRWELSDTLRRDGWENEMHGIVVLHPPDSWRYSGRLLSSGVEMAAFEAVYRVKPLESGGSVLTVEFAATPTGERGRGFIAQHGERMKAHFERVYDRIVSMMTAEVGVESSEKAGT
jgi:hypothetical protein